MQPGALGSPRLQRGTFCSYLPRRVSHDSRILGSRHYKRLKPKIVNLPGLSAGLIDGVGCVNLANISQNCYLLALLYRRCKHWTLVRGSGMIWRLKQEGKDQEKGNLHLCAGVLSMPRVAALFWMLASCLIISKCVLFYFYMEGLYLLGCNICGVLKYFFFFFSIIIETF